MISNSLNIIDTSLECKKIGTRLIKAKLRKFEFGENYLFKNGNFLKAKEYQISDHCFTSKWFQMIVSSVRIKTRLILKQYSNTELSSNGYKKGSLYLDTLYFAIRPPLAIQQFKIPAGVKIFDFCKSDVSLDNTAY